MTSKISENKKIAKNSLYVFLRLAFSSIISIFTTRWVLSSLGVENYGIYNVIGSIVVFLNIVNTAMVTTTYRYIAYEMGKSSECNVRVVFNRSLVIHLFLAILIFLLAEVLGIYYVNNVMNISNEKISDAIFVLHFSVISTVISTLSIPYQGLLTANEKFLFITCIGVVSDLFKILAIGGLTYYTGNNLRMYSIIMLFVTIIPCLSYRILCRQKFYDYIKWDFQKSWSEYKEMISFSSWILLGAISHIAKHQGAQLIINFFWGTLLNASFAIANQVNHVLQMFSNNISVAANPQITKSYSGGDLDRSLLLTCRISKYSAFILMLVGLPFFVETEFIFSLWLDKVPDYATSFCRLMIILALIETLGAGIPALTQATGKIKGFQIVGSIWSLMNLPIAFFVYKLGGYPETITIVYIASSFFYIGVRLYLLKRIINFDIKLLVKESYFRVLYVLLPLATWLFIYKLYIVDGNNNIIWIIVNEIILIIAILFFGLINQERMQFKSLMFSRIDKLWKK